MFDDEPPTVVERVARASFAMWAYHQNLPFMFEDLSTEEHEFALEHAQACIDAYNKWKPK